MKRTLFSVFFVSVFSIYALIARAGNSAYVGTNTPVAKSIPNTIVAGSGPGDANAPAGLISRTRGEFEDDGYGEYEDDEGVARFISTKQAQQATHTVPVSSPTRSGSQAVPQTTQSAGVSKVYKDGTFKGSVADAYYGNVQVQVTTRNGRIVDVVFLDHPHDRNTSVQINDYAMPILRSEAIKVQSAQVDTVSGATATSGAFRESLSSALNQAQV